MEEKLAVQNVSTESKPSKRFFQLNWLLFFIDGWSELIEGMGEKEVAIQTSLKEELDRRNMPDVKVEEVNALPAFFSTSSRPYSIATTSPGATTTVYIAKHGNDLYASWRTFLTPIINWNLIFTLAKYGGVLGLAYFVINTVIGLITGIYEGFFVSTAAKNLGQAILYALGWGSGIFLAGLVLISFFGFIYPYSKKFFKIAKSYKFWTLVSVLSGVGRFLFLYDDKVEFNLSRSYLLSYVLDPGILALTVFLSGLLVSWLLLIVFLISHTWSGSQNYPVDVLVVALIAGFIIVDLTEMGKNLGRMWDIFVGYFMSGLYSFEQAIVIALTVLGGGIAILILAGLMVHRNLIYFLIEQPTLFDLEDITAMSLSVHKSLLRVLDQQGIDVTKLRIKTSFKSGRKGDEV